MTALCGGGTSGVKLGHAAVVEYSTNFMALLMAEASMGWLIPIIPAAGIPSLVLANFCSSDPPAMPTFTQAEADALLNLTLGADFASGLPKLVAVFENVIWNDACQCTSGAYAPAPPAAQPANSITVVTSPGPPSAPCSSSFGQQIGLSSGAWNIGPSASWLFLPVTGIRYTIQNVIFSGSGVTGSLVITQEQSLHGVITGISSDTYTSTPGTTQHHDVPLAAGANFADAVVTITGGTGASTFILTYDAYCGAAPGGTLAPCCPPDTATAATIAHILDVVQSMQRNYAPFGYVLGPSHPNLSGVGSLAVSRLIGVKITLTTLPAHVITSPGNPTYLRDCGWVSVSEVDGMIQELRVARQQFTWLPRDMVLADHINYDFFSGVVATIQEMLPEP
jgi:hypothetical protein